MVLFLLLVLLVQLAAAIHTNQWTLPATESGTIEIITHRDSSFMLDFENWRGPKIDIQTIPTLHTVAIRLQAHDNMLVHRTSEHVLITIQSSRMTLQCAYNTWGMFTFSFSQYHDRLTLLEIDMARCSEVETDHTEATFALLDILSH